MVAVFLFLLGFTHAVSALTNVSGTITSDTTWDLAGSPYVLNGAITIPQGVTLTLSPGVVVKGSGTTSKLVVNGTLFADGTSSAPIVFTSYKDDGYGGDANGDGSATVPSAGDWDGVWLSSLSTGNVLDHVVLRYAGRTNSTDCGSAALCVATSGLNFSNGVVEYSTQGIWVITGVGTAITSSVFSNNSIGVFVTGSAVTTITDSTFSGNAYAVYLSGNAAVGSTFSGNTAVGNTYANGVYMGAGTLAQNATWGTGMAVILGDRVIVPQGVTLSLSPGLMMKSNAGGNLRVDGTLLANGTSAAPIVFTSYKDDGYGGDANGDGSATVPSAGDWDGVWLSSLSTGNVLDHVVLRYAGRTNSTDCGSAALCVATSGLNFSNGVVEYSTQGIWVITGVGTAITSSVFSNNSIGVFVTGSAVTTITDSTFSGNAYAVYLSGNAAAGSTITGNSFHNNVVYGLYNPSSVVAKAERNYWGSSSGPYDPSDDRATGGLYNPGGSGDPVSDHVDYYPWLKGDPNPENLNPFSGFVTDINTNQSIPGVLVQFGMFSAYTDSTGRYAFGSLPDNTYTVLVSHFGYVDYTAVVNSTTTSTHNFGLAPDPTECTGGTLSGTVVDKQTSTLLDGVPVYLNGGAPISTSGGGAYDFGTLPAGTYTLTVNQGNYVPYSQPLTVCNNLAWEIRLITESVVFGTQISTVYGDPVNTATGNYVYQHRDLEIPGIGMPFVFERSYNSRDDQNGQLGFGWTHNWNATAAVDAAGNVTIRWGDGSTQTWAPDGSGGFIPQFGVFDALIDDGGGAYTIKKRDLSLYHFDASSRLTSVADRNGNIIMLTYTGTNLTQITDTAGRVISLTYDASNRIDIITDPISRTIDFDYDTNGDLVSAKDMRGNATTYTYDSNHQILTVVDPELNTVVTNTYDAADRVVTHQSDAKAGGTNYVYDPATRTTTITDAEGGVTVHHFDALLRLIREDDPEGHSSFFVYDSAGNRTQVTDKNGNLTLFTYDSKGNVESKTDAMGHVTTITYDINNNPLSRTDALGNTTTFVYDANSINLEQTIDALNNTNTITYYASGLPWVITDARLHTTTNYYDTEGNLERVEDHLNNETSLTYDGVGRRLSTTNARLHATEFTYDNNNNLLTVKDPDLFVVTHTYDKNNNRKSTVDKNNNPPTLFDYDEKDLLTTTTDAKGKTTVNGYDGLDRRISVKDRNDNVISFEYDKAGYLIKVTDPYLNTWQYAYDPQGNRLTETDELSHTTTYTYDALNRRVSTTDPENHTATTAYDALGRLLSTTNAKGQVTAFEYDELGRLKTVFDSDGGTVAYTYDENGNRKTMTDPNGHTTTYHYDELDRLKQKDEPENHHTYYEYDEVGNLIKLTKPNGTVIRYAYDKLNLLETITYPDSSTVAFGYDANGNRIQMVDSLGTHDYVYDELDQLTGHTDSYGNVVAYSYDANSNRKTLTYPGNKTVSYAYDKLNRMTDVTDWLTNNTHYDYDDAGRLTLTTLPSGPTVAYGYDAADRLTSLSNEKSNSSVISSYTYTLDEIGNHLAEDRNEQLAPTSVSGTVNYTYDNENRLVDIDGAANSLDDNGNLLTQGVSSFTWDFENRLKQRMTSGTTVGYEYDGVGNRYQRIEGGIANRYILDTNTSLTNVLAEADSTNSINTYYIYGLGLIARIDASNNTLYYHYDSRGSTIALTDDTEAFTDEYLYDPFGQVLGSTGISNNPFQFLGKHGVQDDKNNLNYIRARYYDSVNGRFVSKDQKSGDLASPQTLNKYIYALNNPMRFVDISGFSASEAIKASNESSGPTNADKFVLALMDEGGKDSIGLRVLRRLEIAGKRSTKILAILEKLDGFFEKGDRNYGTDYLKLGFTAIEYYKIHKENESLLESGEVPEEFAAEREWISHFLHFGISTGVGGGADGLMGGAVEDNTMNIIDDEIINMKSRNVEKCIQAGLGPDCGGLTTPLFEN